MACYGIVTRLENTSEMLTLVGVHFYKMELNQRIGLAQGLAKKMRETHNSGRTSGLINPIRPKLSLMNLPYFFVMISLLSLWAFIFWSLFHWNYFGIFQLFFPIF
jgi:hypothetical protein